MEDFESLFKIRIACEKDIDAILEMTKEAFLKYQERAGIPHLDALSETYEDIKRDIENKLVIVAIDDGEYVGSVRVEILPDNTAYLTRFGVREQSRNTGVGKSIMALVDKIMQQKGVRRISLHTASKVTELIRFYYGRGFYIESTDNTRGYIRAKLVKEY